MQRFTCAVCGSRIFFDNLGCTACGAALTYDPVSGAMFASAAGAAWDSYCANRDDIGCNWIATAPGGYCASCERTDIIPDLSDPSNAARWARIERAKRQLFYSLFRFGLPLGAPETGLRFRLLEDKLKADGSVDKVLTGHDEGLITLNISEADDDLREKHRLEMGEPYRTLIGHFRHEVGHFYWDELVDRGGRIGDFTAIFGDASASYEEALEAHYRNGPPQGWALTHVSSYATAHPWEDFAETWAHYMHMRDGLETAESFGFPLRPDMGGAATGSIADIVARWVPLTVAMNAINRSMGQPDFYPFVLSGAIEAKLSFIHDLVASASPQSGG